MNLFVALLLLALEWPLPGLPRWTLYHSFELRIVTFMTAAFLAFFLYQATNAAIYYLVGTALYIWAYSEGEVCLYLFYRFVYHTSMLTRGEEHLYPTVGSVRIPCII